MLRISGVVTCCRLHAATVFLLRSFYRASTAMPSVDFKRVKRIPMRYKDIVYGWIKQIQTLFPSEDPYFTTAQLIQDLSLILKY